LEYLVLGPLEARIDERPVALGAPRQRLLLAALLLAAPAPVRRDQLIDQIWGESPPASARHAVEVYVSRLRDVLGQAAIASGPGTTYAVGAAPADARRFEELMGGEPSEAQLTEALALWRGDAYGDVTHDGPLASEVSRLQDLRLVAREQLAERRLQRGAHSEALPDLQQLVGAEPLRERARALLMRALYLAGRQADALDVYAAGRELLVEELGLEPTAELRALQAAILRQDPALSEVATRPPVTLPAPTTPLIGRDEEIKEVAGLLRGAARLVTLTGPGGTGKTRLAVGVAGELLDDFADGAQFVELSALRDPDAVTSTIAHALGLDAEADLAPQLRDRRQLLVLDNFEQLLDAAPTVGTLLTGAPQLRVLATSRVRLDLYGEYEFAVDPLDQQSGVELFCDRARARNRRFQPTPAVEDVVARLECLPLAIELVASRADRISVEAMAGPILELASEGPRDAPDRHRALRAAVDWSLDLLDDSDRQLFAELGVFAGGLDASAAAAVLDATPADLCRLADHNLLRDLDGRWAMLEVLRERALERLHQSPRVDAVQAGHAAHYLELAERSEHELKGPDQTAWGEIVEREHNNLRAALEHADPLEGLRIAAALGFFWYTRGYSAEGAAQLERALAAAPDAPALTRGRAFQALGILRSQRGDDRDEATFREALEMFRTAGDRARVAVALNSLGAVARERGDADEARAAFEEGIQSYRELGDRRRLADSLSNLAMVSLDQDRLEEAAALFADSLAVDREFDNQWGIAHNLSGQAMLALARGATDEAEALLAEAVGVIRPLGDRLLQVIALERLAATAAARDEHARAARLWGAATTHRDVSGEPLTPADAAMLDRYLRPSREALGPERFAAAAKDGAALDLTAALAEALSA
jgi:predicted ATPase/DNA-binding SARP family transcriptional activator